MASSPALTASLRRRPIALLPHTTTTETPTTTEKTEDLNISKKLDAGYKTYYNFGDASLSPTSSYIKSGTPKNTFKVSTSQAVRNAFIQ